MANTQKEATPIDNVAIKKWILESIKTTPKPRKTVISDCVKKMNLTPEELKDTSSNSYLTLCKSHIGQVLSQLLNDKDLTIDADKKIQLNKKIKEIYRKDEIEERILSFLTENKTLTRKNIFSKLEEIFNPKCLAESSIEIHRIAGEVLAKLVYSEIIIKTLGNYSLNSHTNYPNTEIGNCLKDASEANDIFPFFIKALNIKGGEFFEAYCVKLLENYFSKFYTIITSKLTGGPNDNGIDGVIEIEDDLGYREKILIQCKVRTSTLITLKEVREFYGAVCSEKGTRGLFITNTTFHNEANKFFVKNNNLVAVDKNKLYDLAKICQCGIIYKGPALRLDDSLFLQ